jgi:hypothetical protein
MTTKEARVTHTGKTVTFRFDKAKVDVTPGRRFGTRKVYKVTVTLPELKSITYPEIQNPEWPHSGGKSYTPEQAARVGLDYAIADLRQEMARRK